MASLGGISLSIFILFYFYFIVDHTEVVMDFPWKVKKTKGKGNDVYYDVGTYVSW